MQEIQKYDPQDFIAKSSPVSIANEYGEIRTTKQAIETGCDSLALCRKNYGESIVIDTISMYLMGCNKLANTNNPLTAVQITELAKNIIRVYYQISIVEIGFVLGRGIRGEFGKVGSFALTIDMVMDWFHCYQDERVDEFEKKNQAAHFERKNGKVEISETGHYMTIFEDQFNEELKSHLSRVKDLLPESKEEKFERIKKEIAEKGIESTFIDNSNNEELIRQKIELLGENWQELEEQAKKNAKNQSA